MQKKIIYCILILFFISIMHLSCNKNEFYYIYPTFNKINKININFDVNQVVKVKEEDIKSENTGEIQLDIKSYMDNDIRINVYINSFNLITNLGINKPIDTIRDIDKHSFSMILDKNHNIIISNLEKPYNSILDKEDIEKSMEKLLSLMIKNFPKEKIPLKYEWKSEITIPHPIEANPDAYKTYTMDYKLDKITGGGNTAEILFNGKINVTGNKIIESNGNVNGLLNYDLINGFPVRLNIEENYEIKPDNKSKEIIQINQETFINNYLISNE